jgi:hypothetical protein
MEQHAREIKLQIHKSTQGGITLLRFVGTIDETFDGAALGRGLEGDLVISMAEIHRITSFGIRQWMDFVAQASQSCGAIYYVECAPRIVDQFNMVANFGGRGVVVSFYAPFRCEHCGAERLKLIQVDRDRERIIERNLEESTCPTDGNREYFDDDPNTFLSFIADQPPFEMDPKVAAFLAGRTQYTVTDAVRKTRIEKRIKDRFTFISIGGDIAEDFPIQKISEGLEGDVVLDLSGVGRIAEAGFARWRMLLQTIAPTTERILVAGLPAALLEHLTRSEDLASKAQVLSMFLPYSCGHCSITSQMEVDVARHYETIRFATPPELKCPDCGATASCVAGEAVLARMPELPAPASDLKTEQILAWAREPVKTKATAPVPGMPVVRPAAAPSRGLPLVLGVIALVGVLGAAFAVYMVLHKGKADDPRRAPTLLEASHPKPPSWQDHSFTVDKDHLLVVGASSFVADKEEGFNQARAAALEELCHQVAMSVRDPLWVEHVGAQFQAFRAKETGELEKALISGDQLAIARSRARVSARRERVARALLASTAVVQPEQSQFYWEKLSTSQGIRYRVWSLFRAAKPEFKRLLDYYTGRGEALSASAVTYFPSMAWRYEFTQGSVVVGMKPDSPLRHLGVLPGDIILSAQDRVIKDAHSFQRVLTEEYAELERTGGTMVLRIQRGDAPVVEHRLRVAKRTERPVLSGGSRHGGPKTGKRPPLVSGKQMPPANIWDDNPFE